LTSFEIHRGCLDPVEGVDRCDDRHPGASVALAFRKHSRIDGADLASLIATAMSIQSRTKAAAGIDDAAVSILESIGY
jgi:hypothetical protein